ncbi:MAG: transcription elongation factor GreA [Candidatus Wolfebacteria bacterium]|nr:transcription elongation factor GreA [Candidatus Wolfebacteria bacterium]MDP2703876.1 transcription elongation factor GreA [bacterium]
MCAQYLTKDRYGELKEQLERFKNEGRREIAARLKHAKQFGDLSENSEYQEARDAQRQLEVRIGELGELLRTSKIIERTEGSQEVKVGAKVTLKKNGSEIQYTIVGSNEAQPTQGLISNQSPIGRALLGKKVGESFEVETPSGKMAYEILAVE